MATIAQIVTQIRTAIFGKDVRENIAQGIEKCYTDVSTGTTLAETAASNANTKATAAQTAASTANTAATNASTAANAANTAAANVGTTVNTRVNEAVDKIVQVKEQQSQLDPTNKIWIKPEGTEYLVLIADDIATVAETEAFFESTVTEE